jgi:predicted nucleic-acid-binding protein
VAEIAWVLERAYRLPDQEIAAAIEGLLQTDVLTVENEQEVFTAMVALKEGRGSFADALIGALRIKTGCSRTLSFDQRAQRLEGFEMLL